MIYEYRKKKKKEKEKTFFKVTYIDIKTHRMNEDMVYCMREYGGMTY